MDALTKTMLENLQKEIESLKKGTESMQTKLDDLQFSMIDKFTKNSRCNERMSSFKEQFTAEIKTMVEQSLTQYGQILSDKTQDIGLKKVTIVCSTISGSVGIIAGLITSFFNQ